jgi:hypothetical protein
MEHTREIELKFGMLACINLMPPMKDPLPENLEVSIEISFSNEYLKVVGETES